MSYFANVNKIKYEGPKSTNSLALSIIIRKKKLAVKQWRKFYGWCCLLAHIYRGFI